MTMAVWDPIQHDGASKDYTYVVRDIVFCIIAPNLVIFHLLLQTDDQSQMSHALEEIPARFPELPSTDRQL
jgi:hypothetical protein